MKSKIKGCFLMFIILVGLFFLEIPTTHGAVSKTVLREQLRYGYWEIAPVIDNILEDFSAISWRHNYDGTSPNLLEQDPSCHVRATLGDYRKWYAGNNLGPAEHVYTIDPDGDDYHYWGTRAHVWTENTFNLPSNFITEIGYNQTRDAQGAVGPITEIYSSAPEVAFSIGSVYLSNHEGVHWEHLGYRNLTEAAANLGETIMLLNYLQNQTYVYRKIPYSFKVLFWTLGDSDFSIADMEANVYQYWVELVSGGVGTNSYYLQDSYDIHFPYVKKAFVDIDTVEANLQVNIETPLFTSRATQKVVSPDGRMTFYYNNTWIGIMDAEVTGIYGGAIAPYIPTTEVDANGLPTGEVLKGERKPLPSEEIELSTEGQKVIQPTADATEAMTGERRYYTTTPTEDGNDIDLADNTPFDIRHIIENQWGAPGMAINPQRMADPKYWTSYLVAPTQALYASLSNPQRTYLLEWNDSVEYDPILGRVIPSEYANNIDSSGNYINRAIIDEISSSTIDRQYSQAIAISAEIPNRYTINLGAKLRPALHMWTDNIDIERAVYKREYILFGGGWQPVYPEHHSNPVFEVISGVEVVNVFLTYTITFDVVMVDKYGFDRPITDTNAGDDLLAWIAQLLANNTYDKWYRYNIVMGGSINVTSLLTGVIIGVAWINWIYKARQKANAYKISFMTALKDGFKTKIILTVILAIILPMILPIFLIFL